MGYPSAVFLASLVAQLVKNPPEMWETWDQSLSWEDPLEKGKAIHLNKGGLLLLRSLNFCLSVKPLISLLNMNEIFSI